MENEKAALWPPEILRLFAIQAEELKVWQERHPHEAVYVAEEARARVDNDDPLYIPPLVIGSAHV